MKDEKNSESYKQNLYKWSISEKGFSKLRELVTKTFSKCGKKTQRNIMCYLINLHINENKVAVIQNRTFFSKLKSEWHTWTRAKDALQQMEQEGWINCHTGYKTAGFKKGVATTIESTDVLKNKMLEIRVPKYIETDLAETIKPVEIVGSNSIYSNIVLRNTYESHISNIPLLDKVCNMSRSVAKYDGRISSVQAISLHDIFSTLFWEDVELSLKDNKDSKKYLENNSFVTNLDYQRVFHPDGCGRYYDHGSYMNIPRELRKKSLLLNGEETAECDFSAMHVNLLYHMQNIQNPYFEDAYSPIVRELIGKNNIEIRSAVKKYILVGLNAVSIRATHMALVSEKSTDINCAYEIFKKHNINLKDVHKAFCKVHPQIKHLFGSNLSHLLQFIDSDILTNVLADLMIKQIDSPVLLLHDATICPRNKANEVKESMTRIYEEYTGFPIKVEVEC